MQVSWSSFNPDTFSFHEDPVLVIEKFWTASERKQFRDAMRRSSWQRLQDMPNVRAAFPNCGNWEKARIAYGEANRLLERLTYPCIESYMESFAGITGRSLSFSYYSYGSGDCLLTHDDTAQDGVPEHSAAAAGPLRRLALVTYVHEEWQSDWGGELIVYSADPRAGAARPKLTVSHCIIPEPGSLVLFTVPRFHRVCRVDPVIGPNKRLSIAGWFLTEHAVSHYRMPLAGAARSA
ncbi:MAG TPA: 2OG-Fe(II) oxygenase family protein [Nitrospiraceae bacterium]|nr:2OG-Fe(II) oxygenase family protein [Nitrospiraceae bacterium]